jgi:hypothetical protein
MGSPMLRLTYSISVPTRKTRHSVPLGNVVCTLAAQGGEAAREAPVPVGRVPVQADQVSVIQAVARRALRP